MTDRSRLLGRDLPRQTGRGPADWRAQPNKEKSPGNNRKVGFSSDEGFERPLEAAAALGRAGGDEAVAAAI